MDGKGRQAGFPLGRPNFQVRALSFREGSSQGLWPNPRVTFQGANLLNFGSVRDGCEIVRLSNSDMDCSHGFKDPKGGGSDGLSLGSPRIKVSTFNYSGEFTSIFHCFHMFHGVLVGDLNPFEKYVRKIWIISPGRGQKKK